MKMFGGKQRLCMSGWVMAALVIFALNGYAWISLESRPLEGSPVVIKALRQKMARLESVSALERLERYGRYGAAALPAAPRNTPPVEDDGAQDQSPAAVTIKNALPVLSGIVRIADPLRTPYFMAVLDGGVYREREHVEAFLIAEISARGVVLSRDGASWRIENPVPYYSSDGGR